MKQIRTSFIIYVTFHLTYLLFGLVAFFVIPWLMEDAQFFVPMIYGAFLIATAINTSINTLRHSAKRNEKHRQELKQTSFGTETPEQKNAKKRYRTTTLFWIINGILTFTLSLLMVAFSALFSVRTIFRNILDQGGPVNLESYYKIQDTITLLDRFVPANALLLLGGIIASIVLGFVFKSKTKRHTPQKEPLKAPNLENEEMPVEAVHAPFVALETAILEPLEVPQERELMEEPLPEEEQPDRVTPPAPIPEEDIHEPVEVPAEPLQEQPEIVETKEEPIPETPKPIEVPVEETQHKIRPDQIKQPKEESELTQAYLDSIKPLVIKVKSKEMIFNLPNPPSFVALPGLPNVAWVQEDALVIYFDYTSKKKSILDECIKNNPKKFPLSSIEKIILEGQAENEATALYYQDKENLQRLVLPKACYEVLTTLIPDKKQREPEAPKSVEEKKPAEEEKPELVSNIPEPPVEKTRQMPPPMIKPPRVDNHDPGVRLAKLQKLFERKVISQEEYEQKKKEILDTI